jgi:beta-N-acetylhexosaminidase
VISDDLGAALAVQESVEPDVLPEMLAAVRERAAVDPAFGEVVDAAVRTALLAKARAGLLPD